VWQTLRNRRLVLLLAVSGLLIAANWLTFIYAVMSNQVAEASLGNFINPLASVLLGALFLGERLRPLQILSIALAAVGVALCAAAMGTLPWIAVALPITFSLYGLMRKIIPVESLVSLAVETLLLAPLAMGYLGYLIATQQATGATAPTLGLLAISGPVTTVPLLFFGAAARRLRLATLGILLYITPSITLVLAVVFFREPFTRWDLISFVCIWAALALYTADSLRARRPLDCWPG
jgi:chloramphenicol-sensitive protein RarD